ncbi:MAG TPA: CBS domain-containing protein [Povalibacter sp.]
MFAGMWMTTDLITVTPDTALGDAAQLMAEKAIRRLPVLAVINGENRLVGIVSKSDLARAPRTAASVMAAMTPNPLTTTVDAPIESIAAIMRECKIGSLPVMRGTTLIGLITESDVFDAFVELFNLTAVGARITFDISRGEDILPFVTELARKHHMRVSSFASLHERERPMCVVHFAGTAIEELLEDVWSSHHRVESVVRTAPRPAPGH